MEDPVRRCLVLPPTRLEQIAHDGYSSGTTDAFSHLDRRSETQHLMAASYQDLD